MLDTSPEAAMAQAAVHRRLDGARKILMVCEMTELVRSLARERIRKQHPEFSDTEVRDQLTWELYGVRPRR